MADALQRNDNSSRANDADAGSTLGMPEGSAYRGEKVAPKPRGGQNLVRNGLPNIDENWSHLHRLTPKSCILASSFVRKRPRRRNHIVMIVVPLRLATLRLGICSPSRR